MRLTEFWARMERHLGVGYAESYARDHVIRGLGGRTAHEALQAGEDTKTVWRAVWLELGLPVSER